MIIPISTNTTIAICVQIQKGGIAAGAYRETIEPSSERSSPSKMSLLTPSTGPTTILL